MSLEFSGADRPADEMKSVCVCLCAFLVVGLASIASARRPGAAIRCRSHIGTSVQALVQTGLRLIDTCDRRNRSDRESCGNLTGRALFTRALARAEGIIDKYWCASQSEIRRNYPSATGTVMAVVGPFVQKSLEQSARTLQVAPSEADRSGGAALVRCRRAIARARTAVVDGVFARAIRCERRLDRHATEFGVIAPACLTDAPRVEARAARRVSGACGRLSGAEVGSCDGLPDCVIASAIKTAHTLATTTYGLGPGQQTLLCGNGEVDPGETCDEGNMNSPNGACTDTCQLAACGDGKVETGLEGCDNGQGPHCSGGPRSGLSCATDMDCPPAACGPTPSCVSDGRNFDSPTCKATCKAARCGDGEQDPGEQCDDGASNGAPGDGCSATCELVPVSCPAGGTIDVSVTLVPNRDTFSSNLVGGMDVSICYADPLSIPGSGILSVDDPNDPATRIVLLSSTPGGVNLYDGLVTFADVDTTPPTMLRTILALNPTANLIFSQPIPFERIRFDCPSGGQVTENDVPCRIATITDLLARPIQRESYPDCQVTLPR